MTVDEEIQTSGIQAQRISLDELKENKNLENVVEKISKNFDVNKRVDKSLGARGIDAMDGSFTILTDEIIEVTTEYATSYAFRIETPTLESSSFENFIIEKDNENNYSLYIYRYTEADNEMGYALSREAIDDDQVDIGDFQDYFAKMVYDPASDCLYSIISGSECSSCTIIKILECDVTGGSGSGPGWGSGSGSGSGSGGGGGSGSSGEYEGHHHDASDEGSGGGGISPGGTTSDESNDTPPVVGVLKSYKTEIEKCVGPNGGAIDAIDPRTPIAVFNPGWFDIAGNNEQAAMANYLKVNGCSLEAREFVNFASNVITEDPTSELNSFMFDLNLLQDTNITFDKLWNNYEDIKGSHPNNETNRDFFSNYCAINLSHALQNTGITLNSFNGVTCWGCESIENNNQHAIRAQELADWLLHSNINGLSSVVTLTGDNFKDYISGKKGIVFFKDYWQRETDTDTNRTGDHIDLWDGSNLASNNFFENWFRFAFPELVEAFGSSNLYVSKQVLFWEIQN